MFMSVWRLVSLLPCRLDPRINTGRVIEADGAADDDDGEKGMGDEDKVFVFTEEDCSTNEWSLKLLLLFFSRDDRDRMEERKLLLLPPPALIPIPIPDSLEIISGFI
jgi:hypothetical protein